jgi:hypothetical protein
MDTLYLVFKDRFQFGKPDLVARPARLVANFPKILFLRICQLCLIDDFFSPQAKRHITESPFSCQALFHHSCKLFSGMKQPPPRKIFELREAA